ncbi:hypothetical protein I350_04486 [Cryptococcus amylolentus CBS 6273]|uniref:F-box domain-containing protein n=1 Tax=Cryptococcus amylolentus CBS 6273 TaxID=1296118 RepID=A0A1E3K3M0_9TREE|nr:hypothetical protein I350_04486 [Cryptococcus amylolentus CBS 6273]
MSSPASTSDIAKFLSSFPDDIVHLIFDAYARSLPTSSAILDFLCLDRRTYKTYLPLLYHTIELTGENHYPFLRRYAKLLAECAFVPVEQDNPDSLVFAPVLNAAASDGLLNPGSVCKIVIVHCSAFKPFAQLHDSFRKKIMEQEDIPIGRNVSIRLFPRLDWLVIKPEDARAFSNTTIHTASLVMRTTIILWLSNICYTEAPSGGRWLSDQLGQVFLRTRLSVDSLSLHDGTRETTLTGWVSLNRSQIMTYWLKPQIGAGIQKNRIVKFLTSMVSQERDRHVLGNLSTHFPSQAVRLYNCRPTREEVFAPMTAHHFTDEQMGRVEMYTPEESIEHVCEGCGRRA